MVVLTLICFICLSATSALQPIVAHSPAVQQSAGAAIDLPKGTISERVNCFDEATQSYARQREFEARVHTLVAASQRVSLRADSENSLDDTRREQNVSEEMAPDAQLKSLFADLRKQSAKPEDSSERRVARRVVNGAYINFYEQGTSELSQKHFDAAASWFTLASDINPERAGTFFYLACAYAGKGDKENSLRALKSAVDHGFSDFATLADNPLFNPIRDDPQYRAIMQSLQSKH